MERLSVEQLRLAHAEDAAERAAVVAEERTVTVTQAKPVFRQGVQRRYGPPARASEGSIGFLRDLLAEREGEAVEAIRSEINAERERYGQVSQRSVSRAIDALKAIPKVAKASTAEVAPVVRTNRYRGKCEDCGTWVEEQAGVLTKTDEGKWEVAHKEGECPVSEFPFPLGRYAVENADGDLRFLRASMEGLFFMASDELHRVPAGSQQFFVDAIAADPEAASIRYGQEIEQCGRCGRTLTDEDSRLAGIGPVCAKKGWVV